MKNTTKEGLHINCQKEEKEFVSAEEERKFWEMNLLGTSSAKSLLQCNFTMEKSLVYEVEIIEILC